MMTICGIHRIMCRYVALTCKDHSKSHAGEKCNKQDTCGTAGGREHYIVTLKYILQPEIQASQVSVKTCAKHHSHG